MIKIILEQDFSRLKPEIYKQNCTWDFRFLVYVPIH